MSIKNKKCKSLFQLSLTPWQVLLKCRSRITVGGALVYGTGYSMWITTEIHLLSPTSVQGCFIRNMVGAELNLSKSKLIFCKNRLSIAISTWMGVDWQGGLHCTLHCIWNMKQPMSMILSLCCIPINVLVCK